MQRPSARLASTTAETSAAAEVEATEAAAVVAVEVAAVVATETDEVVVAVAVTGEGVLAVWVHRCGQP